jgi:hypothetical protein
MFFPLVYPAREFVLMLLFFVGAQWFLISLGIKVLRHTGKPR